VIALFFAACGVPAERTASPTAVFPHLEDYDQAVHGGDALAADARCFDCHAVDEGAPVLGAVPEAPACRSCHADFPHAADYGLTKSHGAEWAERQEDCVACHGPAGTFDVAGRDEAACTSCHSTYPHAAGWELPAGHGAATFARGQAACTSCHAQSQGAEAGQCVSCHPAYPHAAGFAAPKAHGALWAVDAGASCTESCHPTAADTPAPRIACRSCHDLFPHAAGWPDGHLAAVQVRGEGACAKCHDPGTPAGPVLPVSCGAACHGGGAP
jgi:Cytochrome c3